MAPFGAIFLRAALRRRAKDSVLVPQHVFDLKELDRSSRELRELAVPLLSHPQLNQFGVAFSARLRTAISSQFRRLST